MSRHQLPGLGSPGSLKAVFGNPCPRNSELLDDFVDEMLPEFMQVSFSGSIAASGRRSRLDDSAGEGLRRNVLLRNAMLSSLERERRQTEDDVAAYSSAIHTAAVSHRPAADEEEEAQFFDDLLSELTSSDGQGLSSSALGSLVSHSDTPSLASQALVPASQGADDDEEDFVQLEAEIGEAQALADRVSALQDRPGRTLNDSCSSAYSTMPAGTDSGFAEETSRPPSAASCCAAYPHVCPYPAVSGCGGASSEELPALIDDDDSDLDEDEDEVVERETRALDVAAGVDGIGLVGAEAESSSSQPLSPIVSPVHSVFLDCAGLRDQLSPEPSRPTSPISSASSKGDGESLSPLLMPSDMSALPSLAELSLQPHILGRPPRTLTTAWFETKAEAAIGSSTSAERMRWTSAPVTSFRSTATAPDFVSHRSSYDPHRNAAPLQAAGDLNDHSIVVHWSR